MFTPHSQSDMTRNSLLLRLKQDGPEREVAWVEFHDMYAPIISGFARRCGAKPSEIEDLLQEVLKAFFCVTPEFRYDASKGRFRSYLKTCVWNKLAQLRRNRASELQANQNFAMLNDQAVEAVWNDVWETEKLTRALAVVRQRYATNDERQRTFRAFELVTLLDRSTEEVAVELGLSVESVRAAKSRVSRALRETFDNLEAYSG